MSHDNGSMKPTAPDFVSHIEVPMLSQEKSWVPAEALCVGLFITGEKGDHAKREQAALSSLPVRTRWESDCLTSESYSLGVACTDRARMCMPLAAGGGDSVLRGLVTRVALVMNKCVHARCVVESYRRLVTSTMRTLLQCCRTRLDQACPWELLP